MKCKVTVDTSHYLNDLPWELPEGWVWCSVQDVADSNIGLTYSPSDLSEKGIPVLRSNNIQKSHLFFKNVVKVSCQISNKQYLNNGDLLICARNGSRALVGKCALVEGLTEPTSFGAFMAVCRSICNPWISLVLRSQYFNEYLDNSNSTAINQVTQKMFLTFQIPLPPLNEQNRLYGYIDDLFKTIERIDELKDSVHELAKSVQERILDLAIHGKLVPQDPSDEPAIELFKRINPGFEPAHNLHYGSVLPIGWELCRLDDILEYEQPQAYIVKSTDYSDKYITPVLTPGKSFVLGYTNESEGIYNALPVIIFDDFTTESKYVDFPFKVKSSAMKILRAKGEIDIRYVAFFMSITRLAGDTHKRYWISEYSKLYIPIPPFQEQKRIVAKIKELSMQLDFLVADTQ